MEAAALPSTQNLLLNLDRAFGGFLLVGAVLHAYGSAIAYPSGSSTLVWAWSGSLAAALVAALNLLRSTRPSDRPLALLAGAGALAWLAIAILFGLTIGNVFDFRVVWHALAAAGLIAFSGRTYLATARR